MTLPLYLDPAFADAYAMYEGDTISYETLVWQRFVALANIDTSVPLTSDQKAAFSAFLQRYQAWDFGVSSLTANIPERSDYQAYYNLAKSILSTNSITITDVEARDLWRAFLCTTGYTTPPASVDFSDAFAAFVKNMGAQVAASTGGSPANYVDPDQSPEILLWNRFLEIHNLSSTDTPTGQVKADYRQLLQTYNMWGVGPTVLASTNPLPSYSDPSSSLILNYMDSFYGDRTTIEKTDLWNTFLQTQNLSSNPTDLRPLEGEFVKFINAMRAKEQRSETATSLSPLEVQARTILSKVMESLHTMLTASQNVVSNYATALTLFGTWQQNYTTMMSRVPTLSGISDVTTNVATTLRIPSGDPSSWSLADFTFGYAGISLSDVTSWATANLINPSLPLGNQLTFSPSTEVGQFVFTLAKDASGNPSISVQYTNTTCVPGSTITGQSTPVATLDSTGMPLTRAAVESALTTSIKNLFTSLFQANPALQTYLAGSSSGYLPAIQGRFLDTAPKTFTDSKGNPVTDSSVLQNRSEQNAVLEQYTESIQNIRDALQTRMQQLQTLLATSRDAIDNISEFWSAILDAINTIMRAIVKHSTKS